ncbi:hypothetical protein BT69DRAFT_876554 [Atractiella rhizophila]|nr:hypothetical protein BT69DRAFT_876554 [Atractiella rhizophila]
MASISKDQAILTAATQEDDDGLLEELEREIDEGAYDMAGERERRLEAMNREMGRLREMKEGSHGQYLEIKEEKEVMERSVKKSATLRRPLLSRRF